MANDFITFRVPKKEVLETLRVLKQRETSNTKIDSTRKARLPGKRVSKTGKVYWETRKNRSDKLGGRV
jgi:cation transport regulator ChaC